MKIFSSDASHYGILLLAIVGVGAFARTNFSSKSTPPPQLNNTSSQLDFHEDKNINTTPNLNDQEGFFGNQKDIQGTHNTNTSIIYDFNSNDTYGEGVKVESTKTLQEMNNAGGCKPTKCGTQKNTCGFSYNAVSNRSANGNNGYSTINYTRDCTFGGVPKSCTQSSVCPNLYTYKDGKCVKVAYTMCDESTNDTCSVNPYGGIVSGANTIPHGRTWQCWTEKLRENCIKCDTGYKIDNRECVKTCNSASGGFPYCFDINFD